VVRAGAEVRAVTVFVGAPPAGSTPLLLAPPVGVSDTGLPVLGRLFAPAAANRTFAISLLATPAATDTPVTVTTSDPTVVSVAGQSVVHAGDTVANLQITTGSAGSATLTIEVAGAVRTFTIVSGDTPAPNTTPPSVAPPVGVSVVPNPALGRVISQAGAPKVAALGITLFTSPAGQATSVSVTTNNPSVATINGGASSATLVVNAGEQVLQLPIELSGAQGAALLTFEFDGQRHELVIVVGNPPASEIPAVTAPVVGVQIG